MTKELSLKTNQLFLEIDICWGSVKPSYILIIAVLTLHCSSIISHNITPMKVTAISLVLIYLG